MKFKKFFSEIKYSILPFIILVCIIVISYFGNQFLYEMGVTHGSTYPEIELDSQIPLIPWFVYFYYLTFPLGIITFFYLAYTNKRAFYNMFITLIASFVISGIIYLFAQTVFIKPEFTPNSFTDDLVVWTWGSTNPVNCFPSQHCFMAFAIIIGVLTSDKCGGGRHKMNVLFKIFAFLSSIMIVCSTVFIKQHYFLDIIASFDIMFFIYALVYVFKLGDKLLNKLEKNKNEK